MIKYIVFLFLIISYDAYGIGANPDPIKIKQSDGTSITVKSHGDEWFNWVTTTDGYRVIRNKKGVFEYATLLKSGIVVPSGVKAADAKFRSEKEISHISGLTKNLGVSSHIINERRLQIYRSPNLKSSQQLISENSVFPISGTNKLLVLLVNFSDTEVTYPQSDFINLMNQNNYKGSGSFKDFYLENSGGSLVVNSTVVQWITLPNNHDYYGPDNKSGEFVMDAITKASEITDRNWSFSDFDNDGDGIVDGISIIHQGKGEEGSLDPDDIWSHSYNLSVNYPSATSRTFDGVVVNPYTVQPEFYGNSDNMTSIGVLCHEFGHNLGAPDYYDTDGSINGSFDGTGKWDVMAMGAYNYSGQYPAHHNALTKAQFGWATIETIDQAKEIIAEPIITSKKAFRYNTITNKEFFLVENRQKNGFDAELPGEGLIIYHVDSNYIAARYDFNDINNGEHQGFYPIAAGGDINSPSCSFPGTGNVVEFTDMSDPSALSWSGNPTDKSITGITIDGDNIVFDFMALQNGTPISLSASALDFESIQLGWERSSSDYPVLLVFSENNVFGDPIDGQIYNVGDLVVGGGEVLYYGDLLNDLIHSGVSELTTYHYRLWSNNGSSYTIPLSTSEMTFAGPVSVFPWEDDFEEGLAKWQQEVLAGEIAVDWTIANGGHYSHPLNAFSGNQNALFYIDNYGSVSLLKSPEFVAGDGQKFRLEFFHAQELWGTDQDFLRVLYRLKGNDSWIELAEYSVNIPIWKEENIDFTPGGNFEIAFEGTGNYGYGVVIDKIKIFPHDPIPPVNGSTNMLFSDSTQTSLTISWNAGDGDKFLVVGRKGNPVSTIPDDGVEYVGDTIWGNGDQLSANEFILSASDATQITVTGLLATSQYYFSVFDYYSTTLNYKQEALTGMGETQYGKVMASFTVVDENGEPVENAVIDITDEDIQTDANGFAELEIDMSETYIPFITTKDGYESFWGKLIANENKELDVAMIEVSITAPQIDTIIADYNNVTISWNPIINEKFYGYEPFALTIPNWVFLDLDNDTTYGLFGSEVGFPNEGYVGSFIVMNSYNVSGVDIPAEPYSGNQFLGCVASMPFNKQENNDWIISPPLSIKTETWLSFMAKSFHDDFGLERMRVLVSTDNSVDPSTFVSITNEPYVEVPTDWENYKYDLTGYLGDTIRFAINCVSKDAYLFMLDQIEILDSEPDYSLVIQKSPVVKTDKPLLAQKDKTNRHFAQIPFYSEVSTSSENLSYEIYRNSNLVSMVNGMANTLYTDSDVRCGEQMYTIQVIQNSPSITAMSVPKYVSTCNRIEIEVSGIDGTIEAASVSFDGTEQITNSEGVVQYSSVASGSDYLVIIKSEGYKDYTQTLAVSKDTIFQVTLEKTSQVNDLSSFVPVIYPIPTSGLLYVEAPLRAGEYMYQVYSTQGNKVVVGVAQSNKFNIDMGMLPKGIYLLKLQVNDEVKVVKVQRE